MIRKIITRVSLLLVLTAAFSSCNKYDDSDLQNKFGDLTDRVATIEEWSKTVNTNITSLQGLITAIESNDVITGVTDLADKSGYTISFSKSPAITIKHGTTGSNGTPGTPGTHGTPGTPGKPGKDGTTPIIGAAKFDDGLYYWTIKQGVLLSDWLLDNQGNKIRITGDNGPSGELGKDAIAPQMRIDDDNEWSISTDGGNEWASTGIEATGSAMFSNVETTDTDVTFTLAGGTESFTIPLVLVPTMTIGFGTYETFIVTPASNTIEILLPESLKSDDYSMIKAEINSSGGTVSDIKTRSSNVAWKVTLTEPTFTPDGSYDKNAKVTLSPSRYETVSLAILDVTITDKNGKEYSSTRTVSNFDGLTVNVFTAGELETTVTNTGKPLSDITKLAIIGTMNNNDFEFIKGKLTKIEVINLSQTDITEIPNNAFYAENIANSLLEKVVLSNSIVSIGENAFANNANLENIILLNVTSIGNAAFEGCENITELNLPNITSIGNSAFKECVNLTSVLTDNNMSGLPFSIGEYAFANTKLSSVDFRYATSIGNSAFKKCVNLTDVNLQRVQSIDKSVFEGCGNLKNVNLKNVKSIEASMFKDFINLTDVSLLNVTTIGNSAFKGCENLNSVSFGSYNNLKTIGDKAFMSCSSLGSIDIPASVVTIGSAAFSQCTNLTKIRMFNPTPITYTTDMFDNGKTITVNDDEAKTAYEAADGWSSRHTFEVWK